MQTLHSPKNSLRKFACALTALSFVTLSARAEPSPRLIQYSFPGEKTSLHISPFSVQYKDENNRLSFYLWRMNWISKISVKDTQPDAKDPSKIVPMVQLDFDSMIQLEYGPNEIQARLNIGSDSPSPTLFSFSNEKPSDDNILKSLQQLNAMKLDTEASFRLVTLKSHPKSSLMHYKIKDQKVGASCRLLGGWATAEGKDLRDARARFKQVCRESIYQLKNDERMGSRDLTPYTSPEFTEVIEALCHVGRVDSRIELDSSLCLERFRSNESRDRVELTKLPINAGANAFCNAIEKPLREGTQLPGLAECTEI